MPRAGITAYDLLISCPGDVEKYIEVVKECLEGFNTVIGRINNAEIVGRHCQQIVMLSQEISHKSC